MSQDPSHPSLALRRSRRAAILLAGVAGLGLLAAGAVQAQWDRGWRGQHQGGPERQARFARFCGQDTARYQPVVRAFVRADLRLDQAQAQQFEQLADLVLPGVEELKREVCNDFVSRGAPAPERLKEMAENLRRAADLAERAISPAQTFYASLSDEQKQRVDDLTQRRGRFDSGRR